MRYLAAIAVIFAAVPAFAADKGAPATFEQIIAAKDRPATCHVEASAAGTFLRDNREAQFGAGMGCDVILANLLIGGGLRADFADWRNTGSIFAKLGVSINNGAHLYGLLEWKVPEWKVKDAGQLAVGAGAELKLDIINPNLWGFAEASYAATKWGTATKDDVNTRLGLRYKF